MNRNIPDFEKKVIVFTRWYRESAPKRFGGITDKRTGRVQNFYTRGPIPGYFLNHLDAVTDINAPESKIKDAVASYIKKNPLCCQIVEPDHLGNQLYNGESWMADDGYVSAHRWGYIGDLYIFITTDFHEIGQNIAKEDIRGLVPDNSQKAGFAVMLNNCGETEGFFRG